MMSHRAAVITQADVARAIRAAKQAGAATVEVRRDGTIIVHVISPSISPPTETELATDMDIVL